MVRKMKSPRRLAALALFAIIAMSAFGFAATNTFNGQNRAGNSADTISGFNISNIHYSLQGTNPANLDAVVFTLNQPASEVQVGFDGGTWIDCSPVTPSTAISCTIPDNTVGVQAASSLEVSAVS